VVVDRPRSDGPVQGYLCFEHSQIGTKDFLRVVQINYEDIAALKRQLHFLASLRDQYLSAILTLPADLPLNWLLRESQVPHRLVNHAHAELRQDTRMQVRVLDHKRFIEAMHLPRDRNGRVVVSVQESEGSESRFQVDVSEGRGQVSASAATAAFICRDRVWAAIACGDLSASRAVQLGLASADDPGTAATLDIFAEGPAPFCHEYF
jgi:predicted acetyltransferase